MYSRLNHNFKDSHSFMVLVMPRPSLSNCVNLLSHTHLALPHNSLYSHAYRPTAVPTGCSPSSLARAQPPVGPPQVAPAITVLIATNPPPILSRIKMLKELGFDEAPENAELNWLACSRGHASLIYYY